jgi:glycosyltransferase involved in cell wall biosynthesis
MPDPRQMWIDEADMRQNRILVITYAFPPVAFVGVHRTRKYCQYLCAHGWIPLVLTAKPSGVSFTDEKLCQGIPHDVEVYRTADFDPTKWLDKLSRLSLRRHSPSTADSVEELAHHPSQRQPRTVLVKLKGCLRALLTESPDSHIFWLPFALLKGIGILLRRKVDVIYSTSPPHSSHIIAFLLARLFRRPYVLDFRDPWYVSGSARNPDNKVRALLTLETHTKRAIVRGAAKVICVSKGERDELRAEFPEVDYEHFTYITNGYDPTDLAAAGSVVDRSQQLSLIHAGTIYPGIAGEFFGALRRLVETDPVTAQSIQVQLLGEIADDYADTVRSLESTGIVKVQGLQPHARTLQMVQASDVLVILMGGTTFLPSHLPSKVFEYLHARKPILAIAEEGELTEILRQSGLGIVVRPQSADSVADALRDLVADHAAGQLTRVPNQSYIRSFERAVLTKRLARMLDAVKEAELVRQ